MAYQIWGQGGNGEIVNGGSTNKKNPANALINAGTNIANNIANSLRGSNNQQTTTPSIGGGTLPGSFGGESSGGSGTSGSNGQEA